jgi:hypothetical protein
MGNIDLDKVANFLDIFIFIQTFDQANSRVELNERI